MEEKKQSSDAFGLIYHRYIKDDPARVSSFQEEPTKAAIAREIYDLRDSAGLSGQELALLVDTTESTIEDIEEADYDGDFPAMASRIADALRTRLEVRLTPPATSESAGEVCRCHESNHS